MPGRMRLQRQGKKGRPFYHIVIADGRAPRDGKFIEKIGTYNPLTNPAEILIDFDKALDWLRKGIEPTDTVRAILSYKGVLYKYHLLKGVKKGALTEEQAEAKFQTWLAEKENKINQKKKNVELDGKNENKKRLEAEVKIKEERAESIAKKLAKAAAKEAEEKSDVQEPVAEVNETVVEDTAEVVDTPQDTIEDKTETTEDTVEVSEDEAKPEVTETEAPEENQESEESEDK